MKEEGNRQEGIGNSESLRSSGNGSRDTANGTSLRSEAEGNRQEARGSESSASLDRRDARAPRKWKKILLWVSVGLFAAFCGVLLLIHLAVTSLAGKVDYMESSFTELKTTVTTFEKEGEPKFLLVPMVHIASQDFYDKVDVLLKDVNIILAEGVNDSEGKMAGVGKDAYGKLGSYVGLKSQKHFETDNVVNADGDMSDLSDESIMTIRTTMDLFSSFGKPEMEEKLKELEELTKDDPEIMDRLMKDILDLRNETLFQSIDSVLTDQQFLREKLARNLAGLKKLFAEKPEAGEKAIELFENMTAVLGRYKDDKSKLKVIAVPWGALHIKGVVEHIEAQGFTQSSEEQLVVANFFDMYGALLGKIFE